MDPNINYNVLHEIIQQAKIKPEKLKFNKYNHKMSPWITKGILQSIKYKDELHQKHKMTDPHSTEFDTQTVNLKTYNNLRKAIWLAKKTYYGTIFLQFKDDIRGTWKTISGILNQTKRKKNFPNFVKDNENIIYDKNVITNKFNTFFANIGLSLSEKINMPQSKIIHHYLTHNHNKNTFTFQNINEENIISIIDKFAPKSSFGFDGISTRF